MIVSQQTAKINIYPTAQSRLAATDFSNLPFGGVFADHMLVADLKDGKWSTPVIQAYKPLEVSPALSALHYGQSIFEGMKAFNSIGNHIQLFRPLDHLARLNRSAERLCMPAIPNNIFMEGLCELIKLDKDWCPPGKDISLYIRPIYFATDDFIGMRPSYNYRLIIFTCPTMPFYSAPLKVLVNTSHVRAAEGGVGYVKMAGNYALAMQASQQAKMQGYSVVLWLDARERKYVEEYSTMNAFFVIDGRVVTPKLTDTFLEGITRDSIITLLKDEGIVVEERSIGIDELIAAAKNKTLTEAFGTGTAAVLAPVESIDYQDQHITFEPFDRWQIAPKVLQKLTAIRTGLAPDKHNWLTTVC
jgi:branched-chain amino acid aminotransferase